MNKSMQDIVRKMLTTHYQRHRVDKYLLPKFLRFAKSELKYATFDLTGTMSFQTLDIENAGQILFDFVDIEEQFI